MEITDNKVPKGVRLALENRFTREGGCQISETDMITDIISYLTHCFERIGDKEPEKVLVAVNEYLTILSTCFHLMRTTVFPKAVGKVMSNLALIADIKSILRHIRWQRPFRLFLKPAFFCQQKK